jgi:glutamate synthase (NADPH/NADH) small chain
VGIGRLERFVADRAMEQGEEGASYAPPPTGKKVAIVGSGPAGLTVAADLARLGHKVDVFEALNEPGGVLIYGIPEFRLPKAIIRREVDYLARLGVEVYTNKVIGRVKTIAELLQGGYHAVFIATGAGLPRFMNIPGENLKGVYSSNEFLVRANLMRAYMFPEWDTPIKVGSEVAVIGGGNVAMDSARVALRLGSRKVTIVYRRSREELPARAEEVDHAEEEGIVFKLLRNPVEVLGDDDGNVVGLRCVRMELGAPDDSGRRRPIPIEGSEFTVDADIVIVAIGTNANPLIADTTPDLEFNKWGYIVTDEETGRTNKEGVWAGGDIVTGAATVISAMGAGRKAARSMHQYLTSLG